MIMKIRKQLIRWLAGDMGVALWGRAGIGLGWPHQSDLDHLTAIWRGDD